MQGMKLTSIAYHRNGCLGEGFHAVAFRFREDGKSHNMIAAVFSTLEMGRGTVHPCNGRIAILDADMAAHGIVDRDNNNTWRGDNFEPQLRRWIAQWEIDHDAFRPLPAEDSNVVRLHRR